MITKTIKSKAAVHNVVKNILEVVPKIFMFATGPFSFLSTCLHFFTWTIVRDIISVPECASFL